MHEYMTRHMVALKPFTYADWPLVPGDKFRATPDDAGYLTRCGRAKDVAPDVAPVPARVERLAAEPAAELAPPTAPDAEPDPEPAQSPPEAVADQQPRRRGRPSNASRLAQQSAVGETSDSVSS